MALSRLSTSAFQAYRRVLAGLVVVGGPHGGRGGSKVDARTLFGRGERRGKSQSKVLSSAEVGLFELQSELLPGWKAGPCMTVNRGVRSCTVWEGTYIVSMISLLPVINSIYQFSQFTVSGRTAQKTM